LVWEIGTVFYQMMEVEVRGYLIQAKLASCYYWLVEFIARFGDWITSTHAHGEETRLDGFRENSSGFLVSSKDV